MLSAMLLLASAEAFQAPVRAPTPTLSRSSPIQASAFDTGMNNVCHSAFAQTI